MRGSLLALLLVGCAVEPTPIYLITPIPVPPPPHIPSLTAEQEASLRDDVYEVIENRDNAKTYYIDQLQASLCSTHENPGECVKRYLLK